MADTITFLYSKSKTHTTITANGAQGGITPRGDFKIDFFIEANAFPETIQHSLTPDGLGPEIERSPGETRIEREMQVSVVMSPSQAKSLGQWLLNRVAAFEKGGKNT